MIKIGVTGNIGSGKTTLTKYFENYKSYIFNADKEAKNHLRNHSVLQKKIINIFGNQIVTKNNIDFKKLAEIVFESKKNQQILNGIVWPEISMLIENSLRQAENDKYDFFIVDAALLFEANFNHFFDYIILVTADKKIRLNRALKRNNLDLSQIKKRMSLQLSDSEKIKHSNFTIYNNDKKEALQNEFDKIMKLLQ